MKTYKILLIALLISVLATAMFAFIEYIIGPGTLFISCFIVVGMTSLWCLFIPVRRRSTRRSKRKFSKTSRNAY